MSSKRYSKKDRQERLKKEIEDNPFITDEELCELFNVSIQTIRLDRLCLNIPELRERVRNVAKLNYKKVRTIGEAEIVGELIDLELNKKAISILQTDSTMVFKKTKIVRGHFIFAMAESLAMAVIDADVALTGVSNIKYKVPVLSGQKLIAKAEVTRIRGKNYFVHVKITVKDEQVFRGKFILVSI
ncbi:transcription factor FapR [Paramaledivibacter caminithermalis]|jgi:acyl-coenzyme A thioesterase PaaI-like protein|uniref:Acyl-coenzyme A thioesterase PaaI, contains HGG motif n=1 Tax=Paramaledivibacter caminithermalis (strain DSM 15212 / CIP 107654 / DViRD3) TaxID=1121301 RepID=A0A1M6NIQ2_PARC5|nr:transcription factor FapR [Paramaledivibacter caminithermalis]SHJ95611.1 Acyl-coenzyme A thioesterase PaaI, contains HGG motif [Paramaledivibacter caminithermalis DSM 15212]